MAARNTGSDDDLSFEEMVFGNKPSAPHDSAASSPGHELHATASSSDSCTTKTDFSSFVGSPCTPATSDMKPIEFQGTPKESKLRSRRPRNRAKTNEGPVPFHLRLRITSERSLSPFVAQLETLKCTDVKMTRIEALSIELDCFSAEAHSSLMHLVDKFRSQFVINVAPLEANSAPYAGANPASRHVVALLHLPLTSTETSLHSLLESRSLPVCVDCHLRLTPAGHFRGVALLKFAHHNDCLIVISALNDCIIDGSKITAEFSRHEDTTSPTRRPQRSSDEAFDHTELCHSLQSHITDLNNGTVRRAMVAKSLFDRKHSAGEEVDRWFAPSMPSTLTLHADPYPRRGSFHDAPRLIYDCNRQPQGPTGSPGFQRVRHESAMASSLGHQRLRSHTTKTN